MIKLLSLSCIIFTLISCEDKSDSKMELLEGTWKNTESNFPIITFYEDGKYVNTDLIQVPIPSIFDDNVIPEKVIISGNFNLKNNKIEFITSNVEEVTETSVIVGDIGRDIGLSERSEVIIPNNNSRIWKIISLTENQLQVKYILDTLIFQREE